MLGISVKKGWLRLLAYCLAGTGLTVAGLAMIAYQNSLPIYRDQGIVQQARTNSSGRGGRTKLQLLTPSSGELVLDASGRSRYFRPGEHVTVTYRGVTGSVINATFLKADGSVEGEFNGTDSWTAYFALIVGLLLVCAGFQRHRRDPEGAETPYNKTPRKRLGASVDTASMLHLSGSHSAGNNRVTK
jgi:hypothetical protein